jgi:3-methyladenine DNA glycosylase AlkD
MDLSCLIYVPAGDEKMKQHFQLRRIIPHCLRIISNEKTSAIRFLRNNEGRVLRTWYNVSRWGVRVSVFKTELTIFNKPPTMKFSHLKAPRQNDLTAASFINHLISMKTKRDLENVQRFYRDENPGNRFIGVRHASIFQHAKECKDMALAEIEKLLETEYYEARMGAVSIMDFQAREKKASTNRKKELFDLYIRRHDRINNWDLVDRSAPYVIGGYLIDKPRKILYKLAKSENVWERRTAIVSTYFFIRQNDLADTFRIAGLLIKDEHDLIQKAVGSWIREAGKKDKLQLIEFLDQFAASMPRTMLRYAIEKLDSKEKKVYLGKEG